MIFDLLRDTPSVTSADVCIIGAGAAGITLAVELAGKGRTVLLLEGGGAQREDASQDLYTGEIVGLPHQGVHTGRVRVKGGTTVLWGGQILELGALDFAQRPHVPGSGWPIPKSALTPFYERALTLEGLANVERDDDAVWRSLRLPFTHTPEFESYLSRWCPEPNFARLHGKTFATHPNLHLWLHANAVELITESTTATATALRCRTLTGVEAVFRARSFAFTLGGIESNRFFLQPRPGGLPWNRSGLLGKHYQDHIDCDAALIEPFDHTSFHDAFDPIFLRGFKYLPKLRLTPQAQGAHQTLNAGSTMYFEDTGKRRTQAKFTLRRLMHGRFGEITRGDIFETARQLPELTRLAWRYFVKHRSHAPDGVRIFLRVHCEQEPTSQSEISLSGDRDALGLLRVRFDWRISPRELATIREYTLIAQSSLAGIARVTPDPSLLALEPDFIRRCEYSNHHMGGMRMSTSPETGVVDTDLRLHGIDNTYVCSAAVFPCSGFSNPTHTVLALALRLANHLT